MNHLYDSPDVTSLLYDLAVDYGINFKKNGAQWNSPCPKCGGEDRFWITPHYKGKRCTGSYKCRQCGISGDTISFCIDIMGMTYKQAEERVNGTDSTKKQKYKPKRQASRSAAQLVKPSKQWICMAQALVDACHFKLLNNPEMIKKLENRGIPLPAIKRYLLGYNKQDTFYFYSEWGLPEELKENGDPKKICLPKGILIPTREKSGAVVRLKSRRTDYVSGDKYGKYIAIPDSMNGLSIYGDTTLDCMAVVESELDAIALEHAFQGSLFVVAIGGCKKAPDNVIQYNAEHKKQVLIIPDNDKDGIGSEMPKKWQALFGKERERSGLKPIKVLYTPFGKDIGEAVEQGLDLRTWDQLVQTVSADTCTPQDKPEYGMPSVSSEIINKPDLAVKENKNDIKKEDMVSLSAGTSFDIVPREDQSGDKLCPVLKDKDGGEESAQGPSTQFLLIDEVKQEPENVVMIPITETEKQNPISEDDFSIEDLQLFDWFLNEKELPSDPFKLNAWMYVVDTTKYYESLKTSIACGYRNVRVKTGVLQDEIRRLQDYVNINKNHKTA